LGTNGTSPTVTIGNNGNWFINGEDTGEIAVGVNGVDSPTITSIVQLDDKFIFYFSDGTNIEVNYIPNFKPCYISYSLDGSADSKELFIIFVQNEANPKYYFGFEVGHEYNLNDIIYTNQYRLIKAPIYEYDGNSMNRIGENALVGGESEFVYRAENRDDFTGGIHGDEKFTEINFFADGVRLTKVDLASNFDLLPCTNFSYIQKSTLHETAKGGISNPLHPIEAIHHKKTEFNKSGYTTNNRIIWQANLSISIGYLSLSSISKDFGGKGYVTDNYIINDFDEQGGNKLSGPYNNAYMWNEELNNSSEVKSVFDTNDNFANQFIWDTTEYNKYYRNIGKRLVENNEEWNSNTIVKFLKR